MSFTLIGKHEKDSRANRDGYVTAMQEMMAADPKVCHVDCDLYNCCLLYTSPSPRDRG